MRVGFVYKKDNNGWQQQNVLRPFSAFNVPVSIADPGPDGVVGNGDDGAAVQAFNLDDTTRGSSQLATNVPGYEGTYKTLEFSANKRYGSRYSLTASYSYIWTHEFGNNYFNNRFGTAVSNFAFFGSFPTNPNEHTENEFTNWNAKFSGTVDAGWGLRVTPVLKLQSGAPYGRFIAGKPELQHRAADPGRADRHAAAGKRSPSSTSASRSSCGSATKARPACSSTCSTDELEHRGQHQLALGRVVREADDRARTAHREVRREVRLVNTKDTKR